jgi:[protein-PII] uridylyltransferase
VRSDLERILVHGGVTELVAKKRVSSRLPARVTPEVPTEVEVDNQVSDAFTVVDVFTQDKPGILYEICRVLEQADCTIALSKLGAEGERVTDVFYVHDRETRGKLPEPRIAELTRALTARLLALKGS